MQTKDITAMQILFGILSIVSLIVSIVLFIWVRSIMKSSNTIKCETEKIIDENRRLKKEVRELKGENQTEVPAFTE
ncbi:hypothetical protein [Bacteroides sp.]|uniref:hypothetical protein n=1 Tax=Bacteroides sp. TaxID=29523 RepID=UPI0025BF69A1|nr:hypothetical protein [Bacteroides sp.]